MGQSTSLNDIFASAGASLGAFLSQINSELSGNDPNAQNFLSFLADNNSADTNANATFFSASTPPTTSYNSDPTINALQSQTPLQSFQAFQNTSNNTTQSAAITGDASTPNESLDQTLQQLSVDLHKLVNLIQQKNPSNSKQSQTSSAYTLQQSSTSGSSTVSAATTSSNSQDTTQADTDNSNTAGTSTIAVTDKTTSSTSELANDPVKLSELAAALITLTTAMVKYLEGLNGDSKSASLTAASANGSATDNQGLGSSLSDLKDIVASLDDLLTGGGLTSGDTTSAAGTAETSDDKTNGLLSLFQNLVSVLDRTGKQIVTLTDNMTQGTQTQTQDTIPTTQSDINTLFAPVADNSAIDSNLLAQFGAMSQKVKNAIATTSNAITANATTSSATVSIPNAAAPPSNKNAVIPQSFATDAAAYWTNANNHTQTVAAATPPDSSAAPLTLATRIASEQTFTDDTDLSDHNGSAQTSLPTNTSAAIVSESGVNGNASFAQTLSSMRTTQTPVFQQPSAVDQAILQITRGLKNGSDQMSLQLHPADLGKITVKLEINSDGKVQGTVTADNPKTLDMLQKDSRSLERALQDAGLRADSGSLSFNLSSQSGQNSNSAATGKNGDGTTDNGDGTFAASADAGLDSNTGLVESYYITPNGVNIRV